jgi:autotransporter-associated beta strand protein
VTISAPASGTQATATATIDNGLVTGLTIVNPGSGYTVAPTVSIAGPGVPNSFSGPTTVNSGTLVLSGNNASSITIGSSGVLETALVTSNSPTTTGFLDFRSGAKVRPVGTPTENAYTLVTADVITGTPELETSISGYTLKILGNSLILEKGVADGFATYLSSSGLLAGTAFDASLSGVQVGLVYAFGSANGLPQNNGVTAVPVMSGNQLIYTFDVKDDPALTVTYQTSDDLVTWTTWPSDKATDVVGAPNGFLKKQLQFTGSGKLFIRINVTHP